MPINLLPSGASPFVLPMHKDEADPPRFHLRPLKSRTMLELQGVENPGAQLFGHVAAALIGIDNVTIDGEPLECEPQAGQMFDTVHIPPGAIPIATIDKLPTDWVALIAQEVANRETITPDDAGK